MASDPERVMERAAPAPERAAPDPWGVKRAENLLASLQGVLSARVVVSPIGEVTEVHVLTQPGMHPKQVVRNVESALLAQLGLKVDHRKISVAQTADVKPIEALEQTAVKEASRRRGIVFQRIEVRSGRPHRVTLAVMLTCGGDEVGGEADSADTPKGRVQAAARATVTALEHVLPEDAMELDGCKIIQAFDMEFAFAVVHVMDGRESLMLTGTCEVQDSAERAAVLAVLDATNRWTQSRR